MPRSIWGQVYQRPDRKGWYIRFPTGTKTARGRTAYRVKRVKSRAAGEQLLENLRAQIILGRRPAPRAASLTVLAVLERYIDAADIASGTVRSYRQTLAVLAGDPLATMPAGAVRPRDIERWLAALPHAKSTKRRHLAALAAAFALAHRDELIPSNPTTRVKRPRGATHAKEILRAAEIDRLLGVCEGDARAMVLVGLYTGARSSEITALRWDDVDFGAQTITIRRRKTHNSSTIRLHAQAAEGLFAHRATSPGGRVVQIGNVTATFKLRLEWAGITRPGISPHSMRHTFATHFIASGGSPRRLQTILGHASISTTERYVRDLPDLADAEIDALDFWQHTQSTPEIRSGRNTA